ncbi:MAG: acyl carrier protein [Magnetococcales bacterium]|nr:acyl carrier protein [Magnetococcales bacterium]
MSHTLHDARMFKVLSGVLGKNVQEVARLAERQEAQGESFWDSLQHINIILGLEAEFGIRFELLEAVDLKTVPLIRAKLACLLG